MDVAAGRAKGPAAVETRVRRLPKLRLLSYDTNKESSLPNKTAEQFWKEYDAQKKGAAK